MPNSSVFIFLMLRALCRMIHENEEYFFLKNSLNVPNVKLFLIFFFNVVTFFMHFCWEWHLALYIFSDFPGIRNLSSLNDLNSLNDLSGLNGLNSLISSKTYLAQFCWQQNDLSWSLNVEWIIKNPLFYGFLAFFLLKAVEAMDVAFIQI